MQNLAKLFYPPPPSDDNYFPSKAQQAYHFNSPSSSTHLASVIREQEDFESVTNGQRSNSIRLETYQNNLFDSAVRDGNGSLLSFTNLDRGRPSIYSCQDQEQVLFERAKSPNTLQRGRSLTTQSLLSSSKKKGVLVIKKESINRQNSQSRSPSNIDTKINMTQNYQKESKFDIQNSPTDYYSPKIRDFPRFGGENSSSQDVLRDSIDGTQVKNSVIVRKTVGELKRAQLNVFYFDNPLVKSQGNNMGVPRQSMPFAPTNSGLREQKLDFDYEKLKGFELGMVMGRNSLGTNYQHFIQKTDMSKNSPGLFSQQVKSKSIQQSESNPPASAAGSNGSGGKNSKSGQSSQHPKDLSQNVTQRGYDRIVDEVGAMTLSQKYAQNRNMREQIRDKLNQSSGSDEFERQSSFNAGSMDNLNTNNPVNKQDHKKIVIQKNKVNFLNIEQDQSNYLTKSQGQIVKVQVQKSRDSLISLNNQRRTSDKIDSMPLCTQSQSPECLRRQKSDNLFTMHTHQKQSLNHERSQNYLSLYTSNKLDVPKVLKAVQGTFCQDVIPSPVSSNLANLSQIQQNISKKNQSLILQTQNQTERKEQNNEKLMENEHPITKSRQNNNIFQVRRSQTMQKDKTEQDQKQGKVIINMTQKREQLLANEKYPIKKREQPQGRNYVDIVKEPINGSSGQNEGSRVSQSLLLDNFYSRSKERLVIQRLSEEKSKLNIQDSFSIKSSEQLQHSTMSSQQRSSDIIIPSLAVSSFTKVQSESNEYSSKEQSLSAKDGKRNTLSYSLNRLIDENRCNSPVRISQYLVDIDYIKAKAQERISNVQSKPTLEIENGIEVYQARSSVISQSNSNNAILSLSSVNTTEKFKEIIDFLFVPTASAFKKKGKEREFRRPTQNPIRRSKSQQRVNKVGTGKAKDSEAPVKAEIYKQ